MSQHASQRTFLSNASVLTLDGARSVATGLVIEDGIIARVLTEDEQPDGVFRKVDLSGATVLPGFIDPHCHPLGLGAAASAIDCSPAAVDGIFDLRDRVADAARHKPDGWIRARGYDELLLAEKRHPTALDLDEAAPGRCVRLTHGSGHADVLSTAGMAALGITRDTVPPPGGSILTVPSSGQPSGVLFEMGDWLRGRMPASSNQDLVDYVESASKALVEAGVTSVTDAGRSNTVGRMDLYSELALTGRFLPRPTVMLAPGQDRPETDLPVGVRRGAVKIAITFSGGVMYPSFGDLAHEIGTAHRAGRQVAVHAIELEAIVMACEAFSAADGPAGISARRHRIEHAAECPPEIARIIASTGLSVATQPGFVLERGDRYLAAQLDGGFDAAHLYPARTLAETGVRVAGSSDAPFGPVAPLAGIQAAVTRMSVAQALVGAEQVIDVEAAQRLYGPEAAWIDNQETEVGSIEVGKRSDLVVLSDNPAKVAPDQIGSIRVLATLIGGELAFGDLPGF